MCICIYYKQYPCFVIAEWAVSSPRTAGRNGEVRFGLCPYMLYSQQTTFSTYQTVRRCQLIRSKSQQSQRKQNVLNRNRTWILWSIRVHTMYSPNVKKESCLAVLSHMRPSILRFSATLNIFRSRVWLLFALLFFLRLPHPNAVGWKSISKPGVTCDLKSRKCQCGQCCQCCALPWSIGSLRAALLQVSVAIVVAGSQLGVPVFVPTRHAPQKATYSPH